MSSKFCNWDGGVDYKDILILCDMRKCKLDLHVKIPTILKAQNLQAGGGAEDTKK